MKKIRNKTICVSPGICKDGKLELLDIEFLKEAGSRFAGYIPEEESIRKTFPDDVHFFYTIENFDGKGQETRTLVQAERGLGRVVKQRKRFFLERVTLIESHDQTSDTPVDEDGFFVETTPYDPSSPYSASKAAADHLVRAWHRTYGLNVTLSNCSNNYGPYQFPEKLIPLMIDKARRGEPLPVYGDGSNVRDWLYVVDHCRAVDTVVRHAPAGSDWVVGGNNERSNLQVVHAICDALDAREPLPSGQSRRELVTFVTDRPGHDWRYAIDASKIQRELGWSPSLEFEEGLAHTLAWYLDRQDWVENIRSGAYRGQRLGLHGTE